MTHLFFKATGFTSGRDLPQLSGVEPLIPNVESASYGHWLYGGGSNSLIDKVNSRVLTAIPGATATPSYTENSLNLSTAIKNGLISNLEDKASQDIAMCAVVKVSSAGITQILGNLVASSDATTSGVGVFVLSQKVYVNVKPTTGNPTPGGINSLSPDLTLDYSKPFFVAFSVNKTLKKVIIFVSQGGVTKSAESTFSSAYLGSLNNFAVGNSVYSTGNNTASFYESIIFNNSLTFIQIEAIAMRSKERLANRNVSF